MEPDTEKSLSEDFDEKLVVTTSEDVKQKDITEDDGESSTESELGSTSGSTEQTNDDDESSTESELGSTSNSTEQSNDEGSSGSKESSREKPVSMDFLNDMNEKYDDCEFVVLRCEKNEVVSVPVSLAVQSGMIRHALEIGFAAHWIPIPTLPVSVLEMIMEYWKVHVGEEGFDEEHRKHMYQWETEFFTRIGPDAVFDLLEAANYLDAQGVLERGTEYVAELIKEMRVDEIRAHFGMKNDFTPEEEQQLRKDFPWADEDIC